jgi:hypothetical protein
MNRFRIFFTLTAPDNLAYSHILLKMWSGQVVTLDKQEAARGEAKRWADLANMVVAGKTWEQCPTWGIINVVDLFDPINIVTHTIRA